MGFGSAPEEDPADKKRRNDEAARADAERLRTAQENLTVKTESRQRRFGSMSVFGQPGAPVNATPQKAGFGPWPGVKGQRGSRFNPIVAPTTPTS
jgi:hypothetical protein